MNLSSFCFGLLFLLKASFAQSAPHSFPDEDEEALIDKLASLAAAVGPDTLLSKPPSYNYDVSQLGYLGRAAAPDLNDEGLSAREAVLPRQFGYKPNDIRFYLPVDQFPQYPSPSRDFQAQMQPNNVKSTIANNNERNQEASNDLNTNYLPRQVVQQLQQQQQRPSFPVNNNNDLQTGAENANSGNAAGHHYAHHEGGQLEMVQDGQSDFYFMKKKEQVEDSRGGPPVRSYLPRPSNIMSSADHSASFPQYTSSQMTEKPFTYSDMYYIAIVAGCSAAAVVGLVAAGICWYRIHERIKAAADVDYPAYGVTGPSKDVTPSGGGDRKLAQSAQMYHYQHQKQQMAALQKGSIQGDRQGSGGSDVESDDDNEDGDYTVYECPGLAPAGEMEVKNPLFHDEATPTPQTSKGSEESVQSSATASAEPTTPKKDDEDDDDDDAASSDATEKK